MAYRRKQTPYSYSYDSTPTPDGITPPSSAASQAIRASAAYRDSSLSSAYEQSALPSPRDSSVSSAKDPPPYESTKKNMNEPKQGFWGALARKAKAILDDDDDDGAETQEKTDSQTSERAKRGQQHNTYNSSESHRKTEGSSFQKGLGAIASSLNHIGNALEEGITKVENRTADIIQETRKIQIRKKSGNSTSQNQASNLGNWRRQPQTQTQTDMEIQLKASRDVSMAMAAKAKLLLRELKTVKADLAFAKERCGQLEEENKILRESREKGNNLEDDDLIRLQLESLLAEKARLAQENSVYARENRFLREIVEYHQLTMQDVVYLDEGSEEVTEVYPIKITTPTNAQSIGSQLSPSPVPTVPKGAVPTVTQNASPSSVRSSEIKENPYIQMPIEDLRRH